MSKFDFGNSTRSVLAKKDKSNKYDFKYIDKFDINEKNDSHAAICRQVTEGSTVLDVGCSSGIIGRILKKYNNCIVDGIEYDSETIKFAEKTGAYRKLYNFSITEEENDLYKLFLRSDIRYDFIIFGDVLEHLYEPWKALEFASKVLKKNGRIIISLPNVSHIDIIRGLINNDFNYNDVGLLDNTHIRFFTSSSFCDMLNNLSESYNLSFSADLVQQIIACPDYVNDDKIFELFNIDNNLESMLVLQNIIVLKRVANKSDMKFINFKKNNYFKRINEYYTAISNDRLRFMVELDEKDEKIKQLLIDKKNIEESLNDYSKKYFDVILSKRWKITNKIFDLGRRKKNEKK